MQLYIVGCGLIRGSLEVLVTQVLKYETFHTDRLKLDGSGLGLSRHQPTRLACLACPACHVLHPILGTPPVRSTEYGVPTDQRVPGFWVA